MKSFLLAVIAALFFPLTASAVQLITFYAECNLGLIDTFGDRISTPIGSLEEWNVEAMDYGPDGLLYATVQHGCLTHGSADTLAIIDPAALLVVPIGPINAYGFGIGDVDALAFDPNGELFGVSMASYELITINPVTGAGTPVGPLTGLPGSFLGAIEFMPDGKLYGIDMLTADGGPSSLWEINRDTGAASLIGGLGFDSVEGMTLNTGGFSSLLALAKSMEGDEPAQLIRIDITTGQGIFIQDMPLPLPDYPGARDALVALPAIEMTIDIKPGSWPNSINLRNGGLITVAVLSTEDMDATTVRTRVARFGPAGAAIAHKSGHFEDVNLDGLMDLVMHFNVDQSGIECGAESAELRSSNEVGLSVRGADGVRTVACK